MTDFAAIWERGLNYAAFLDQYASPDQRRKWDARFEQSKLSDAQIDLLASFRRTMPVIVSAGAWCGDCIDQCPAFERFAQAAPVLQIRYFDRDEHPDVSDALATCGGRRVPSVLFLSEDFAPCGRYGDRTLSKYRSLVASLTGETCSTGLGRDPLLASVIVDWLNEFERVQWMLRLSPRLRQKHGD